MPQTLNNLPQLRNFAKSGHTEFQSISSFLSIYSFSFGSSSFFLSFFLSTSLTSKGSTSLLLCFDLLLSSRNSFLSNRMRRLFHFGPKSSFLKLYFVQLLFFYISLHHKKELFFKKCDILGLFFVYFRLLKQTILTTIKCEKCPSSKWYWDSNS